MGQDHGGLREHDIKVCLRRDRAQSAGNRRMRPSKPASYKAGKAFVGGVGDFERGAQKYMPD